MAFHQRIQSLLLTGIKLPPAAPSFPVEAPPALGALIATVAAEHADANARAIAAGDRYRSAFWALYLLSALAVLCAVMPLALGWDGPGHAMHAWAGFWAVMEVLVIAVLGLVYRRGHINNWQGQWLASRTEAELAWYLPLVAPLVVPGTDHAPANWYARLAGNTLHVPEGGAIESLCRNLEGGTGTALQGAWSDPAFVAQYVAWAAGQFDSQRKYHQRVALRSEALMHRVHLINGYLFGLTLAGAVAHLLLHSMWLSFVTIFFPALGASLHGALAQTESYRLAASSRRLAGDLEKTMALVADCLARGDVVQVRRAIEGGLVLILDEHRDWHMLVRPHHLPLG